MNDPCGVKNQRWGWHDPNPPYASEFPFRGVAVAVVAVVVVVVVTVKICSKDG